MTAFYPQQNITYIQVDCTANNKKDITKVPPVLRTLCPLHTNVEANIGPTNFCKVLSSTHSTIQLLHTTAYLRIVLHFSGSLYYPQSQPMPYIT